MIKFFIFLILLLPFTAAIAVSPTSLDLTDGTVGKMYVYNTLDTEIKIQIDGLYKENFSLAPEENKLLNISVHGDRPGIYEGQIIIKEIYDNGFINAISIPVSYSGSFSMPQKNNNLVKIISVLTLIIIICIYIIWKRKTIFKCLKLRNIKIEKFIR